MMRYTKIIIGTIIIALISVLAIFFTAFYFNQPVNSVSSEDFYLVVSRGATVSSIANELEENNLIKSATFFRLLTMYFNTENSLKAGQYFISPFASSLEIHNLLTEGRQQLFRVRIPEGLRASAVAQILEDENIVSAESFMISIEDSDILRELGLKDFSSAEGFLFPDTYLFQHEFPASLVLKTMVDNFWSNILSIYPEAKSLDYKELYEKLILASIVEKEYRVASEAPLIAGVFYNRLNIDMPLQSCATIVYVITEEQGKSHPTRLFNRDLEIPSDFNTYIHRGLPPTPIANPGKTALNAVFFPKESNYLFFVLKDEHSGEHYFSATYNDHIDAKRLYIHN